MRFILRCLFLGLLPFPLLAAPPKNSPVDCSAFKRPSDGAFYEDSPTYMDPIDDAKTWKYSLPAKEGMDPKKLDLAAREYGSQDEAWSLLVVKNNALIYEKYFHGSNRRMANNIHSASKSIISAGIGAAIQDGFIKGVNQSVSSLLPKQFSKIENPKKIKMPLEYLLTMRGGFSWIENISEYWIESNKDWVRTILNLPLSSNPGSRFLYNTALTHLSSAVITEATKKSSCDYIHSRVLEKIGVRAEHWGRDPQGYFSGGYNVYLTPREMAKFGLLYLNDGKWGEEQILPVNWVRDSLKPRIDTDGEYFYGYNWWVKKMRGYNVAYAWGHGGQFIFLVKELSLVVVLTANTRDYLGTFNPAYLMEDYILPAVVKRQ